MKTPIVPTPPKSAVRRLAAARIISISGSGAAYTALNFTIYERTGSATWLAAALLLTFGVTGIIGPVAGMLGDRFDRRKVMIGSDLAGAGCFLAMALGSSPSWLLVWGFASAVAESPFWSASEAAIPNLVDDEHLSWANSLLSISRSSGITVGPALGGALVALAGARWVFAANALSFVISAAIVATVHARFSRERDEAGGHGGVRAGFAFLIREPVLRTMLLGWVVFVTGMGMGMVADVPLTELFHAGSLGYGLLVTAWGGGAVVGGFLGRNMTRRTEGRAMVLATAVAAVMAFGVAASPWFSLVLTLLFAFGVSDGVTFVAEQNLRQRRTPDAVRSRVAAAFGGVVNVTLALSYLGAAVLLPVVGPRGIYVVGGVTGALAAFVLLPILRHVRAAETEAKTEAETEAQTP